MNEKINVLIVDDEKRVTDEIEEFLLAQHYKVYTASRPSEAMAVLEKKQVEILILDVKLPEMDGLEVLKKVKAEYPDIEVIMISGHGDMATVIQAMRLGATDYFPKPFRLVDINNAITRTQRFIQLNQKLKDARSALGLVSQNLLKSIGVQLIGNSKEMAHLIDMMTKVANAENTSVLILGESGTGKELVAHGIHHLSKRASKPFYSVNCSAIPETLFESEFFGHKKGAYTGAVEEKAGWFEIADKGTLFLDEISDMPLSQQAKLLRVLEERKVSKLGSKQSKSVNVRVIAASNQHLEKMAEEKKFRLDLYHRLSIFVINIPPLRERADDIPLLFRHYINYYAKQMEKGIQSIDDRVLLLIASHPFPGNIRELKNIAERAVILCDGNKLLLKHIQFKGMDELLEAMDPIELDDEITTEQETSTVETPGPQFAGFDLEDNIKQLVIQAMEASEGNKAKAAELLNVSWQALDRKLKKYGLDT